MSKRKLVNKKVAQKEQNGLEIGNWIKIRIWETQTIMAIYLRGGKQPNIEGQTAYLTSSFRVRSQDPISKGKIYKRYKTSPFLWGGEWALFHLPLYPLYALVSRKVAIGNFPRHCSCSFDSIWLKLCQNGVPRNCLFSLLGASRLK